MKDNYDVIIIVAGMGGLTSGAKKVIAENSD